MRLGRIYTFTTDYRRDRGEAAKVNLGFWVHHLPRLIITCRLRGHKPVVDGYGDPNDPARVYPANRAARWVTCDRCGVRPEPQGNLDPELWSVGEPYVGPFASRLTFTSNDEQFTYLKSLKGDVLYLPGPWTESPEGVVGGQLVLLGGMHGLGGQIKIGNAGSEHTVAAHVQLDRLVQLYLHTERFGTWLQRRLNPVGYDSRVIGAHLDYGDGFSGPRLRWELWAKRDAHSRNDPRWRYSYVNLNPLDKLFGESRFTYANVDAPVTHVLHLPDGDQHEVRLQLQRCRRGRPRGHWTRSTSSWLVDVDADGIPTKPGNHGNVTGFAVNVADSAVARGDWTEEALGNAITRIADMRSRYGYAT